MILYRSDSHTLKEIFGYKKKRVDGVGSGFYPQEWKGFSNARLQIRKYLEHHYKLPKIRKLQSDEYSQRIAPKDLQNKFYGNVGPILSAGFDKTCGGQTGMKSGIPNPNNWKTKPIYRFEIKGLVKHDVMKMIEDKKTREEIGFRASKFFGMRQPPILWMDHSNLDKAKNFGLSLNASAVELCLFTPVPFNLIYKEESGVKLDDKLQWNKKDYYGKKDNVKGKMAKFEQMFGGKK